MAFLTILAVNVIPFLEPQFKESLLKCPIKELHMKSASIFLAVLILIFSEAVSQAQQQQQTPVPVDLTKAWFGNAVNVASSPSYLDMSFSETGTCSADPATYIEASVSIYSYGTNAYTYVRYRKISPGEQVNFYVDVSSYKGSYWIVPMINFTSHSTTQNTSCFKLNQGSYALNQRTTHFPSKRLGEIQNLANTINIKDNRLGANDMFMSMNDDQNDPFRMMDDWTWYARLAGAKSFRFQMNPNLSPIMMFNNMTCANNTCLLNAGVSASIYNFVQSQNINLFDELYETLADRQIIALPVLVPEMIDPMEFTLSPFGDGPCVPSPPNSSSTVPACLNENNYQKIFMNIFQFQNSTYQNANGTLYTPAIPLDFQTYFNINRVDVPDWMLFDLNDNLINRYANDFGVIEVFNEVNSAMELNSTNSAERSYYISRVAKSFSHFSSELKQQLKKITILGDVLYAGPFAVTPSGQPGSLTPDAWMTNLKNDFNNPLSNYIGNYDYLGFHSYIYYNGAYSANSFWQNFDSNIADLYNNFGNKKIMITEFGWAGNNFPDASYNVISQYPSYIKQIRDRIYNNPDIQGGLYFMLLQRHDDSRLAGFGVSGATANYTCTLNSSQTQCSAWVQNPGYGLDGCLAGDTCISKSVRYTSGFTNASCTVNSSPVMGFYLFGSNLFKAGQNNDISAAVQWYDPTGNPYPSSSVQFWYTPKSPDTCYIIGSGYNLADGKQEVFIPFAGNIPSLFNTGWTAKFTLHNPDAQKSTSATVDMSTEGTNYYPMANS